MQMEPTRRAFLETAGAAVALAGTTPAMVDRKRPKIAAVATVYHYLSHAYHIVGRFLDGFVLYGGEGLHRPDFEVASLFIEQTPEETDLGRDKAKRHGV